jgi:membrane-associated phospholipid phosphatase
MVLLIFVFSVSGCSTAPNGPAWGSNATLAPGWSRAASAAEDAALSPVTWAPLAAAGLLQIDHADRHIAHWASDHTPIFGSRNNAQTASDALLGASVALYGITALAAPSYKEDWYQNKAQGLAVGAGAAIATEGVVEGLKQGVDRQRPDDSGHDSFPSTHAALATVSATMTERTIDTLPISDTSQFALKGLAVGLSVGTDYARVESRKHYPSDVLVGAAIGHFMGVFADEAFLGLSPDRFVPTVSMSRHGGMLGFQGSF